MADYNLPKKSGTDRDWYKQNISPSPRDVTIPITDFEKSVRDTFRELESLLLSKHKDYGPLNISDSPGGAINGLRVRMHDKLARINNLYDKPQDQPMHEPLEDSFKDMANYAIIGLLVLRGQWNK